MVTKKRKDGNTPNEQIIEKFGCISISLIIIACLLVGFSFFAPSILTREAIALGLNFSQTGQIGDTISGLMNPFIALAGVIVTGLAFYMQYKANLLQRKLFNEGQKESNEKFQLQFDYQRFESQFYEMLRLHKENVNELKLNGKQQNQDSWENITVSKRQVFQQMYLEFEFLLHIVSNDRYRPLADLDDPATVVPNQPLTQQQFNECYRIFFWGFDPFENYELPEQSIKDLKSIVKDRYPQTDDLKFSIEAYQGHAAQLGHYFRHLFMMVKFVVKSEIVTEYQGKMRYLKILRAQLSNYEQIMLFYNWVSGYGGRWEDEKRKFFTEYCMIHNLWYDELFNNDFIKQKIDELKNKTFVFRKGPLFEIDDRK